MSDSPYYLQSVGRALVVLEQLSFSADGVHPQTLAREQGWNRQTTYRLLKTLEAHGAIRRDDDNRYHPGPLLLRLAGHAIRVDVRARALPHLQSLHAKLGETTTLAILSGADVILVERLVGEHILRIGAEVGSRLPAHCTAQGLVLLAGLPDAQVALTYSASALTRYTGRTITSMPALLDRLAEVRHAGYALTDDELEEGHRAVAAPVRDAAGEVAAAIDLSVPAPRVSLEQLRGPFLRALEQAADRISIDLGAPIAPRTSPDPSSS